ncbi:hypothetical protein R1flu_023548 [Riccia fluitans]|uniref:Response regulatory domain-containing protein n=1 Tax=Riccia fluitans TaxID=41844 RepID=A0ABD1XSE9_9MARC
MAASDPIAKVAKGGSMDGRSIMLIEIDDSYLRVLECMLVQCGCRVTACRKVGQALDHLREKSGSSYDLILSSANMPNVDIFKFVYIIRFSLKIPVILMSFDEKPDSTVNGMLARGSCGYLRKPLHMDTLQNLWSSDDYLWSWQFKNTAIYQTRKTCQFPSSCETSDAAGHTTGVQAPDVVRDERPIPFDQIADVVRAKPTRQVDHASDTVEETEYQATDAVWGRLIPEDQYPSSTRTTDDVRMLPAPQVDHASGYVQETEYRTTDAVGDRPRTEDQFPSSAGTSYAVMNEELEPDDLTDDAVKAKAPPQVDHASGADEEMEYEAADAVGEQAPDAIDGMLKPEEHASDSNGAHPYSEEQAPDALGEILETKDMGTANHERNLEELKSQLADDLGKSNSELLPLMIGIDGLGIVKLGNRKRPRSQQKKVKRRREAKQDVTCKEKDAKDSTCCLNGGDASGEEQQPDCEFSVKGSKRKYFMWTAELQKKFDDAVNELGGFNRATRRGVFEKLNDFHGILSYGHVSSHWTSLQKRAKREEAHLKTAGALLEESLKEV